jgi:hypothetical protein
MTKVCLYRYQEGIICDFKTSAIVSEVYITTWVNIALPDYVVGIHYVRVINGKHVKDTHFVFDVVFDH